MAANDPVYTDNTNGLSWINSLNGMYANGCNNGQCPFETIADGTRQVKTEDSEAAQACQAIGARLPTVSEFRSLIRNFDHL